MHKYIDKIACLAIVLSPFMVFVFIYLIITAMKWFGYLVRSGFLQPPTI
jgi:hypothetical protein